MRIQFIRIILVLLISVFCSSCLANDKSSVYISNFQASENGDYFIDISYHFSTKMKVEKTNACFDDEYFLGDFISIVDVETNERLRYISIQDYELNDDAQNYTVVTGTIKCKFNLSYLYTFKKDKSYRITYKAKKIVDLDKGLKRNIVSNTLDVRS